MATVKGKDEVKRFVAQLPGEIERKLLRGAGRAAVRIVADEARRQSISDEVTAAIGTNVRSSDGQIIAKVQVKGPGAYIAPWLEYGTDPHFISVRAIERQGQSINRINKRVKEGSLVIGGQYVGETVHHPGAKRHPFLRVSLDTKEGEAIAAAQSYINARVTRAGIIGNEEPEGDAK